jgi:hypothetical protein
LRQLELLLKGGHFGRTNGYLARAKWYGDNLSHPASPLDLHVEFILLLRSKPGHHINAGKHLGLDELVFSICGVHVYFCRRFNISGRFRFGNRRRGGRRFLHLVSLGFVRCRSRFRYRRWRCDL